MQVSRIAVSNPYSTRGNQKTKVQSQQSFGRASGSAEGWYDGTMAALHTIGWDGIKYGNSEVPSEGASTLVKVSTGVADITTKLAGDVFKTAEESV